MSLESGKQPSPSSSSPLNRSRSLSSPGTPGKRVLIAYDGSEETKKALQFAAGLFRSGDHVVLATVLPPPGSPKLATVPLLFEAHSDTVDASNGETGRHSDPKQAALKALDSAAQILTQQGITVTSHVIYDADIKTGLQHLAELHHCDLVVLGKEKRGIVKRMRHNSLSDAFMSSNMNVVVVN